VALLPDSIGPYRRLQSKGLLMDWYVIPRFHEAFLHLHAGSAARTLAG
jgi:hypothetical protein